MCQQNDVLHTDYGGLHLDGSLWFTRGILEIYSDAIVLTRERVLRQRRYVLPRKSITRLHPEPQLFWFLFSGGLRIEHTLAAHPQFLFYSRDIEVLTLKLQQNGFPISTSNA